MTPTYTINVELGPGLDSSVLLDQVTAIAEERAILSGPAFAVELDTGTLTATFGLEAINVIEAVQTGVLELRTIVHQALEKLDTPTPAESIVQKLTLERNPSASTAASSPAQSTN